MKKNKKICIIGKLRKYFILEPLVILWALPGAFNYVSIQKLGREKACRVNLNYSMEICDNMLDKSIRNITCLEESETTENSTKILIDMITKSDNFSDIVCTAEIKTQKLIAISNGIKGPIAAIFPIIVILFAGGWSDRHNLRKPCMLYPMIGETLSSTALLISSIFFDTIPMDFGNILERVIPSMFGGSILMVMGIFSYLTATTAEEDRTFRFGIMGICVGIIPLIGQPVTGLLYQNLGYINIFALGIILPIIGILYLIYFVDEVHITENETDEDMKDIKLDITSSQERVISNPEMIKDTEQIKTKKSCLLEFFDLRLAIECIKVFTKQREHRGRMFLMLLIFSYALFAGPSLAEIEYLFEYIQIQLTWSDNAVSIFNTYSSAIILVGTFLMTSVFSKLLHMSDAMVGIVASLGTIISKPFFAFSKDYITFYAGQTIDMFGSTKTIAIKTIISSLVAEEELGRLYSILGIFEALSNAVFPPIYSAIYLSTIESFPGAFYLFGEIFYVTSAIIFVLCYWLIKPVKTVDTTLETKVTDHSHSTKDVSINSEATESSYL